LTAKERVSVPALPGHLQADAAGNVWIAASGTAPTEVWKLSATPSGNTQLSNIYRNDGKEIAAANTAAASGKHLLIGSGADRKLLLCDALP
jgi:hypothetical protein